MKAVVANVLCALALLLAAYGCGQDSASPQAEPEHRVTHTAAASPVSTPTAAAGRGGNSASTESATSQPAVAATSTPLPAATPSVPRILPDLFSGGARGGAASGGDTNAASTEDVLERGLRLAGASPVHIAFLGTAEEDSVRCEWCSIAPEGPTASGRASPP